MPQPEWQRLLVEGAGVALSTTAIEWVRGFVGKAGVTIPLGVDFPTLLVAIGAVWGRDKIKEPLLKDFITGLGLGAIGQLVSMFVRPMVTGLVTPATQGATQGEAQTLEQYVTQKYG